MSAVRKPSQFHPSVPSSSRMSASAKIKAEAQKKAMAYNSNKTTIIRPRSSNSYLDYYRDNCNSIDARTFTGIRGQIFEFLQDKKCPPEVKILFGDWMFRKIYMYFKMKDDLKEEACENLCPAIDKCKNTIVKGEYLSFHDIDAVSNIALNFYLKRFSEKDKFFILQMLNDVQLVKNFIQDPRINDEGLKNHFIKWLKSSVIFEQQSNLLDVLLRYYSRDREVMQIYNKMRFGNKGKGTLYQDEQNVHDTDIQNSVLEAAGKLLEWDKNMGQIIPPPMVPFKDFAFGLVGRYCRSEKEKKIATCVIERMCIDHTNFPVIIFGEKKSFTISDIFLALMNYIGRSSSRSDLVGPLNEEMAAMAELCSSGYPTHFINILRGFDDRFEVSITFSKQLHAVISHAIHIKLEDAPENVILGSFENEHRRDYVEFIQKILEEIIPRLNDDYGEDDVRGELANTLRDITGFPGWRVENGNKVHYEYSPEELEIEELSIKDMQEGDEEEGDSFTML